MAQGYSLSTISIDLPYYGDLRMGILAQLGLRNYYLGIFQCLRRRGRGCKSITRSQQFSFATLLTKTNTFTCGDRNMLRMKFDFTFTPVSQI